VRTTPYSHILRGVTELIGIPYANLLTTEFETIRTFTDRRLAVAWEAEPWPELMRLEQRWFRANYASGTAYTAGQEVYYPVTDKYYHALRATTGNAPDNVAYWAESKTSYSGDDWVDGTAYAAGDIVFYTVTRRYYQCHTAHTASSTLIPTATGGNARWGELVPFDRYISLEQTGKTAMGEVFEVWGANPNLTTRASAESWGLSTNGIQLNTTLTSVWVQFRIRRPRLTGSAWSGATAYTTGAQVYREVDGTGNFYTALQNGTNKDPASEAAYWSAVEIPYIFEQYLVRGAYADYLASDGQNDKAGLAEKTAEEYLRHELDKLMRQQGQVRRIKILR
jgi:hypothetical protein